MSTPLASGAPAVSAVTSGTPARAASAASAPAAANGAADAPAQGATGASTGPLATMASTAAPDPLAELRGIHLPAPVGLWPPAPGWWLLAGLLLVMTALLTALSRRRRRSAARQALRELDALAAADDGPDLQRLATGISALLRRVALLRFGRARVAPLHGSAWQSFLSTTAPRSRRRSKFVPNAGLLLSLAPYAPAGASCLTSEVTALDRRGLIAAARAWIKENA
jgi:hypothetical protein